MAKTLYEIMQPEIDEAIEKARAQAIAEGAVLGAEQARAQGIAQGIEQGKLIGAVEAVRGMVERLIRRGGFSEEEIAELAGLSASEVHDMAVSLRLSPA